MHAHVPWLSWSVVLAVVASFGWYGMGWLVDEVYCLAGGGPAGLGLVGAPFGGVYWLMTVLLPGYAYFRYPAKLLVVAALGLSLLAARGFDDIVAEPSARFRRMLLRLASLSLAAAAMIWAIIPFWDGWLGHLDPDPSFGRLDTSGAAVDLIAALLHTAVLSGLFWCLLEERVLGRFCRGNGPVRPSVLRILLLLLTAVDLAVANGWMVVSAPARQWQEESKLAAAIRRRQSEADGQPYRALRHPVWIRPALPPATPPIEPAAALERMSQAMQWDRDTLWPKYNLTRHVPLAEVRGTMMLRDYEQFLAVGKGQAADERAWSPVFQLASYVILPAGDALAGAEPIAAGAAGVSLWANPRHLPRAWIAERVELLPPIDSSDPAQLRRRTEEVLYPRGQLRDLLHTAVVEADAESPEVGAIADPPDAVWGILSEDSCRVVHYDPLRVEIEAELARPGLLVLCDQFYPGWQLEVQSPGGPARSVPILRTNRVMRGAWLPEGRHRLVYRYRPASFTCGAIVSGLAWLGLVGWATLAIRRNGKSAPSIVH